MKTCLIALTTATGFLIAVPVRSADAPVPGDQWESTVQMEMPGMGMSMPARTQQVCVAKNSGQPPVSGPDKNCQMYDVASSGNTTRWKMRCTGERAMNGEGEMTYQGRDAYSGNMKMSMDQGTMTMKMSGKRLGDCDAGAGQRQMAAVQKQADDAKAQSCASLVSSMQVQYFDGTVPSDCGAKYKADFCKRLSTQDGYDQLAARDKPPTGATADLEAAGKACNVSTADVRGKLCKNALAGKSLVFLARNCPDEAAPIAQTECAGRAFSGSVAVAPPYQEFCGTYARHNLMQASGTSGTSAGGAAGSTASGDGQQGTGTTPPPQDSALDTGKKALKKLFPF